MGGPYQVFPLRERWQWRSNQYSPKLQHNWSLTIRCLVSYPGYSLRESDPCAEMQLVYSSTPADFAQENPNVKVLGLVFPVIPAVGKRGSKSWALSHPCYAFTWILSGFPLLSKNRHAEQLTCLSFVKNV